MYGAILGNRTEVNRRRMAWRCIAAGESATWYRLLCFVRQARFFQSAFQVIKLKEICVERTNCDFKKSGK
jgi:hypothetical protein